MKLTMKKLLVPVLAGFTAFFVATGSTSAQAEEMNSLVQEVDLDQLSEFSNSLLQTFASMSPEELELQAKLYDLADQQNFATGFTNYEQQVEALGEFQEIVSTTSEKTEDGYISHITAQYSNKTLEAEIGFDENLPYRLMMYSSPMQGYTASLTDFTFTPDTSMGENVFSGLANMIVGMGTVFVVLIFISWVISMLKHVNKFGQPKQKEAPKAAPAPAPVPAAAPVEEEELAGDDALAAVIAAAIAAYEGDGQAAAPTLNNGLVIRSIKRHRASGWNRTR